MFEKRADGTRRVTIKHSACEAAGLHDQCYYCGKTISGGDWVADDLGRIHLGCRNLKQRPGSPQSLYKLPDARPWDMLSDREQRDVYEEASERARLTKRRKEDAEEAARQLRRDMEKHRDR